MKFFFNACILLLYVDFSFSESSPVTVPEGVAPPMYISHMDRISIRLLPSGKYYYFKFGARECVLMPPASWFAETPPEPCEGKLNNRLKDRRAIYLSMKAFHLTGFNSYEKVYPFKSLLKYLKQYLKDDPKNSDLHTTIALTAVDGLALIYKEKRFSQLGKNDIVNLIDELSFNMFSILEGLYGGVDDKRVVLTEKEAALNHGLGLLSFVKNSLMKTPLDEARNHLVNALVFYEKDAISYKTEVRQINQYLGLMSSMVGDS